MGNENYSVRHVCTTVMPGGRTARECRDVGMDNEGAGGWVSAPQGETKKGSSTLETQRPLVGLVVVVVIGVHVLERGTVRHSPTVVLVPRTVSSAIWRRGVERLVPGAPFQSLKGRVPFGDVWHQFADQTVQYTVVGQTPPSLFSLNLVTDVLKGRVQGLKHRLFTFRPLSLLFGSGSLFSPERHGTD